MGNKGNLMLRGCKTSVCILCIEKVSGIVFSRYNIRLSVFVTGEYLSLSPLINNPGTISHIKCVSYLGDYELIWFKRPGAKFTIEACAKRNIDIMHVKRSM